MDDRYFSAQHVLQSVEGLAVGEGETIEAGADEFAAGRGGALRGLAAESFDFFRHVAGREERLVVGIDQRLERLAALGHLGELGVAVIVPLALKLSAAFLHQPQAHDVLEEADRAADAALVGVVVTERFGVDDWLRDFDAHQRPRAGADIAPVVPGGGDGGNRAGRIVTGGGDHGNPFNFAFRGHIGAKWAEHTSRWDNLRQDGCRQIQLVQKLN